MEHEKHRRFAAAFIMQLANLGSIDFMWEVIAQTIASYISTNCDIEMFAGAYSHIFNRVHELLDVHSGAKIWDELVPGPVRDEPDWDVLMGGFERLMSDPSSINKLIDEVVQGKLYPNIVLDYKVILRRYEDDSPIELYAHSAEFFADEHNIQWVKFTPKNSVHHGKEHMWRTDSPGFAVIRDAA
jgi:hypothetical protein